MWEVEVEGDCGGRKKGKEIRVAVSGTGDVRDTEGQKLGQKYVAMGMRNWG